MTAEQRSPNPAKASPSSITIAISVLTHLLLLAPVIYIIVLSAKNYSPFSWHPILTTIGVGLLMLEAVFCVSGEAYISSRITRKNRILIHWLLQSLGFGLMLAGVIVIIVRKESRKNPVHFKSVHGKLGLSATILCALIILSGIFADNTKWFYPRVRPITIKIIHAVAGMLVTIVSLATVINGTYSWWPSTIVGRDLTFASFVIGTFFIMIKPVLGAVSRSKFMFRKTPSNT
ncbi:transmembrane reductase CYB561D2-like [Vespula pensylvanica]|nr:transmembrane reductase CYB561D2-like [Vespula pensylvanica]XP_043684497.1 transmembrane reductase CYB561D2-like [Vespula pensylvanica]XP_043684498.1 transmembrane reductase CYB561D2-like [Vespula pensylvanica]XP_043684500.1 transmembrane reductase CYB561D2-like [Vespula pensylvanica]XP_043684501.1 transmembrane reductase CYB561D2-like [Vespula pensylvanica]XP_043684502.1 transmembrane reductase CYB561D2-like [Vespula pensylvanica]